MKKIIKVQDVVNKGAKLQEELKNKMNSQESDKKSFLIGLIIRAAIVFICVVLAVLIVRRITHKEEEPAINVPVVNVTNVAKGSIEKERSVMGTIMPSDTFYVVNKVGGEITKIYVSNGQKVKKGDKICDIDNSKQIDAAFIEYDAVRKSYERMEKLYEAGDISKQSFEQVKAQYDGAKLKYDTQVEFATPVATGDGVVENVDMTLNVTISSGKVLCYITSNDVKQVEFGVTESVLDGINLYDTVRIEKQGKIYNGTVTDKATLISPSTGLFNIKAVIDDKNTFASGVMAKVTFVYEKNTNTYVLPKKIVYYENTKPFVYVVGDGGIISKKFFKSGIETTEKIEALSGLTPADEIIATWHSDLAENATVKINTKVNIKDLFDTVND